MAILTYEDIKTRFAAASTDYERQLAAQEYKCAACGRDLGKWIGFSESSPVFTDEMVESSPHELICHWCASDLRFEMNRAENMQRIMREQAARQEYIRAQMARLDESA